MIRAGLPLLLLSLLTLTLFGFFGLRPLLISTLSVYSQLRGGAAYEVALAAQIEALASAKKNFAGVEERLEEIEAAIPQGPSQPELIQELSLDAGRGGVDLRSVFFRGREEGGEIGSDIFDLAAEGEGEGLVPFLKELEEGRLIVIESLQAVLRREKGREFWGITIGGRSLFKPFIP